jgi:hypothetical protein
MFAAKEKPFGETAHPRIAAVPSDMYCRLLWAALGTQ